MKCSRTRLFSWRFHGRSVVVFVVVVRSMRGRVRRPMTVRQLGKDVL